MTDVKPAAPDYAVRSLAEAVDVILGVMPNNRGAAMHAVNELKVKIFADGADLDGILEMAKLSHIKGFTTNPTLMRKAGVTNYEAFARGLLEKITQHPVSFEVFADDFPGMIAQARAIASWGRNVNVKVPVMNTRGEFTGPVLRTLAAEGVEAQRHRDHDAGAGRGRRRGAGRQRCRRSFPCSPGVSPIRASTRCRTCAACKEFLRPGPRPNCCGPARARC